MWLVNRIVVPAFLVLSSYYLLSVGQYIDEPNRMFKKITFDSMSRGSFNLTPCVRDLVNCWEIITPETLCHFSGVHYHGWGWQNNNTFHGSVCDIMKLYCHDFFGDQDNYFHWFKFDRKEYTLKLRDCRTINAPPVYWKRPENWATSWTGNLMDWGQSYGGFSNHPVGEKDYPNDQPAGWFDSFG